MPAAPTPDTGDQQEVASAKRELRGALLAARRARPESDRAAARDAIGAHLSVALGSARCVAAYLPLPSEPLDRAVLRTLAQRTKVLIPLVIGPSPLDWCEFTEITRPGLLGIEEPDGRRLGPGAIAGADVVLVPALAVSVDGYRLGRGGGHYDRTLALRAALRGPEAVDVPQIALIYDEEFPVDVPHDRLDRPVSAVVTPSRGLVELAHPRGS